VHRDLKPSNVMLCRVAQQHDFVKVLDFGLAKSVATNETTQLTLEGVVTGTPGYMAPEVALGKSTIDGRADIYALGCLAYVLLTGTMVFPESNPLTMALNHVRTLPDPPSERTELSIPPALERLILQCLEKEPAARPASAAEVSRLLAACDCGAPWTARDAALWWERHLPPSSSLRSFAQPTPATPAVVQKAS
jgi:serine/threonine-protein kinase